MRRNAAAGLDLTGLCVGELTGANFAAYAATELPMLVVFVSRGADNGRLHVGTPGAHGHDYFETGGASLAAVGTENRLRVARLRDRSPLQTGFCSTRLTSSMRPRSRRSRPG